MIKEAELSDTTVAAELALLLWPELELEELAQEMKDYITQKDAIVF